MNSIDKINDLVSEKFEMLLKPNLNIEEIPITLEPDSSEVPTEIESLYQLIDILHIIILILTVIILIMVINFRVSEPWTLNQ